MSFLQDHVPARAFVQSKFPVPVPGHVVPWRPQLYFDALRTTDRATSTLLSSLAWYATTAVTVVLRRSVWKYQLYDAA
jgi:hypothetical protein